MQDAKTYSNGEAIDFDKYGRTEHDLALCWTNQAVDAVNKKWNDYYAPSEHVVVKVANQTTFKLHNGLRIMAYKSNGKPFHNSDDYIVKCVDGEKMILLNDFHNTEINVDIK